MRIRELNEYERESLKRISYLIDTYCNGKQIEFAERTGIQKSSVSQYTSFLHAPTPNNCKKIADTFHVNVDWVRGYDMPMKAPSPSGEQMFSVPLYDAIPSGSTLDTLARSDTEDVSGRHLPASADLFALRIADDSMSPRIRRGDIVIARRQEDAASDDLVIASLPGKDAVCRRFMRYRDGAALLSDNPACPPAYLPDSEKDRLRIIGKVIELRARF